MKHILSLITSLFLCTAIGCSQDYIGSKTSTKTSTKNGVTTKVTTEKKYTADGRVYITTTTEYSNSPKKKVEKSVGYEQMTGNGQTTAGTITENKSVAITSQWSEEELKAAKTGNDISVLSPTEEMVLTYINLARLYPKKFAEKEVLRCASNPNSAYVKSLVQTLSTMKPQPALTFSKTMYEYAKCFAIESGESGKTGHVRSKCQGGNFAECCCYGLNDGHDIVLLLLIDEGVPSLGHRKNCLSADYTSVGCSLQKHKKSRHCCVIDFER